MQRFLKDVLLILILPLTAGLIVAVASVSWGPRYEAEATLMIGNGPEYGSQTAVDDSSLASRWTLERILNTETEILNADDLKRGVIRKIGVERILGTNLDGNREEKEHRLGLSAIVRRLGLLPKALPPDVEALQMLRRGLNIKPVKNSGILHVTFTHADKALSVEILHALLDEYVSLRRSLLQIDMTKPLKAELLQQIEVYQALTTKRRALEETYQVRDIEQETQAFSERQNALRSEADRLARELASTAKQIEIQEAVNSLKSDRGRELNAEKAGQVAAAALIENQLNQIREQRARVDQVAGAFRAIDQELATRKTTTDKLHEMIAAAELTAALSTVTSPPRILQAPTANDDPVSLPPLMVAGLAAIASLIALIAVRLLERKDEDLVVAMPDNAPQRHSPLSPLPSTPGDNVVTSDLKRKGIRGTRQ